jgi:hypothetical protein
MALTVTKNDLLRYIGRKLGKLTESRSASTLTGAALADCTDVLNDALRRFYEPDVLPEEIGRGEKHQWSFLFPTVRFAFTSNEWKYLLPADFSMIHGPLVYARGEDTSYGKLEITAPEKIQDLQQRDNSAGVPRMAAVRTAMPMQGVPGRQELIVYPTSSGNYSVDLTYKVNPYSLDADTELPLGGQAHVQTLIASCMAAAALFDEYEGDKYERRFIEHLRSSISHDRQLHAPESLGVNYDTSDGCEYPRMRCGGESIVTYNGTSY